MQRGLPRTRALTVAWTGAAVVLISSFVLSVFLGVYRVSAVDVVAILVSKVSGGAHTATSAAESVVWDIRLPRALAGLLTGGALSVSGAVYQGIFRNPLVSPDVLGVSTGASLGAIAGIFLGLPVTMIQATSFVGGIIAVAAVYAVGSALRHRDPILAFVLTGIAIGSLAGAFLSLLKILADPYDQLPAMTYWLLGSLSGITKQDALGILPAITLGILPLVLQRWRLNLLTLDDDEARSLGLDVTRHRTIAIVCATLMTSAAVSVSGVIGWVGLMIPHMSRMLVGPDFSRLLPMSALLGGSYLVLADLAARSLSGREIPLGIITATMGAPFFLFLLMRSGKPEA